MIADQVIGAALVVGLLHGRRNFVVGLGDHVAQPDRGGVIAPGAKWIDAGHAEGLAPRCESRRNLQPRNASIGCVRGLNVRSGSIVSQRDRSGSGFGDDWKQGKTGSSAGEANRVQTVLISPSISGIPGMRTQPDRRNTSIARRWRCGCALICALWMCLLGAVFA